MRKYIKQEVHEEFQIRFPSFHGELGKIGSLRKGENCYSKTKKARTIENGEERDEECDGENGEESDEIIKDLT